ncbi:MAG: ATP-dependent DNA ligase [Candidatus Dependentiae bacterium]|nr:ATP-dependent DNA ligase [Candidatus Dependentiae bacterium]
MRTIKLFIFFLSASFFLVHLAIKITHCTKVTTMHFNEVGKAFSVIEATSGRLEMTKLLADLLSKATSSEAAIICNISLGQLNAPHIGTQFNMAEKSVAKAIADLMDLSDATIMAHAKKLGDLGLVLDEGSWQSKDTLTVHHVYAALHAIEQHGGTGSQEDKIQQLRTLLSELDPVSAKYVVRIIIGKLRLGFSDMTIIDALSWMVAGDKSLRGAIEDAYNICADIGTIASVLKQDGIQAIKNMKIHMGIPIRPAAAERLPTAKAIIEKIGHCVAQPKLDGFRLQIHVDKTHKAPRIHFYSRNLQDMSAMFPDIKQAIADLDVQELICEGEAIVYDQHTGSFLPFQETVKRKRKHGIEEAMTEYPLRVFIFDLLYLDGQEYMTKTHEERRTKLLNVFKSFNNDAVQVIEEKEMHTAQELEHYFTQNIASGLEGLVVKKNDSVYQPGKRNFNWIKLKRQEEGHLEDTLDCVILGYYAGEGKRASFGIGAFLVGVYNKREDRFETVAKIGTGLKDHDWIELRKKCDAHKVFSKPKNVVCAKDLEPDVWVAPEMVVLIRADEITMSPVHAAGKTADSLGYALRFPRIMGYRLDKSPQEATTIEEIKHLYDDQFKRD